VLQYAVFVAQLLALSWQVAPLAGGHKLQVCWHKAQN